MTPQNLINDIFFAFWYSFGEYIPMFVAVCFLISILIAVEKLFLTYD